MKASLTLSVMTNVILLSLVLFLSGSESSSGREAGTNAAPTAAYSADLPASGSPQDAAAQTADESPMSTPAGLIAMMRQSGVSEVVIAEMAKAMAKQELAARRAEILNRHRRHDWEALAGRNLTLEQTTELAALDAEAEAAARSLVGDAAYHAVAVENMRSFPQLSGLPTEKLIRLAEIERDYNRLMGDAQRQGKGYMEAAALINAEKDADLRAAMSPAEYDAVKFFLAPEARQMAAALRGEDIDDRKFRAAYDAAMLESDARLRWKAVRPVLGDSATVKYLAATDPKAGDTAIALKHAGMSDGEVLQTHEAYRNAMVPDRNNRIVASEAYAKVTAKMTPAQKAAFDQTPFGRILTGKASPAP